jgi:hypothetical protein
MTEARRIRKLSLKVSDSAHVYGAATRIEEAFRLVSLPGENEGRHYYFRSLNLGKFRKGEDVTLLTLRLQREFERLMSQAVHAEDPRAPVSSAVYFQSQIEPLRYALSRIARGLPLDAWFVRSAVPDFQLPSSRGEAVQSLLEMSAQSSIGQVNTAHLLAELLAHGELEQLLPLISAQMAEEFLAAFTYPLGFSARVSEAWGELIERALPRGFPPQTVETVTQLLARGEFETLSSVLPPDVASEVLLAFSRVYAAPLLPVAWINLIQKAIRLWSISDKRALWLTLSALIAEAPARLSDRELIYKAQAVVLQVAGVVSGPLPSPVSRRNEIATSSKAKTAKKKFIQIANEQPSAMKSDAAASAIEEARLQATAESPREAVRMQPAPEQSATEKETAAATISPFAGFYFLLHVLRHLGITEFIEANPKLLDVNFPWILLRALAAHAGIKEDDPLLSCAAEIPDGCVETLHRNVSRAKRGYTVPETALERKFTVLVPELWAEIFPKAQPNQPIKRTAHALARLWIVAVHRWLWRFGRLRIREVVQKRGAVSYSRPQFDITLLLRGVDIRVRRLGLDVDPAWVAWLGLIVRFHYENHLGVPYATGNH